MNSLRKHPMSSKRFFWKNLASLMAISLIPVIFLGVLSIIIVNSHSRRNVIAANEVMLNQACEVVEYVFGELDSINIVFSTSSNIINSARSILRHEGSISFDELQILRILQSFLDGSAHSRTHIHSIYIYFDDSPHRFLSSGVGIINTDTFADTDWIADYLAQPRNVESWTQLRTIGRNDVISIYRRIHFPGMRTPEGVTVLNIRADYINSLLANFRNHPDSILMVRDKYGSTLFSTSDFHGDYGAYEITRVFSQRYQWEFISATPTASLYAMAFSITSVTITIIMGLAIVALIIALKINRSTYSGLNHLLEIFDAAQNQKPLPSAATDKKNEYFYIAQNIVKTFVEQDYLKMQLSERKYKLQAMELNALKAQINPHFLFNVLETLYWKAFSLTGNKNEVNIIMEDLSDILKYSLYGQSDIVSLKDEIKYAKSYLKIQKLRFSEQINVTWCYNESDGAIEIPKLILQPIIENSIHHGIDNAEDKVSIKLHFYPENDVMNIKITDDGAGISSEKLETLRIRLRQSEGIPDDHIGLFNTHKRLVLLYGDEFGIQLDSQEGVGTSVHLTFPFRKRG